MPEMPERYIVQLSVTAAPGGEPDIIYAAANDGTLWEMVNDGNPKWMRLPSLPQPEREQTEAPQP